MRRYASRMKNYTTENLMRAFVRVLCSTKISEAAIQGIGEMMWGNKPAMDELVTYIEENPKATEAQITKKASQIMGIG